MHGHTFNAEKYVKSSTDASTKDFWHEQSVDSFQTELFNVPVIPEPISTFTRYLSGISRKILHCRRTAG